MSLVAAYGMDGVFIATLIAGIILLLAGILHLGKLTSFIPAPRYHRLYLRYRRYHRLGTG